MAGRRFDMLEARPGRVHSDQVCLRRDPIVRMFDTDVGDFAPQVTMDCWSGRGLFKMHLSGLQAGSLNKGHITATDRNGFPCLTIENAGIGHKLYALPSTSHVSDGGFEWEVILDRSPESNVLTFPIATRGLSFYKQLALTEEELARGCERPEHVVNSYAVYHETLRHVIQYRNGRRDDFGTGKAFHIYRPKAIDLNGETAWCDLDINSVAGLMFITIPPRFLREAVFPIVIDPEFGYNTEGASSVNAPGAETHANIFDTHTAGSGETITELHSFCRVYGGSETLGVGVYDMVSGDPDTRLGSAQSITVTNTTVQDNSVTGLSLAMSNGSTYCVAIGNASGTIRQHYDSTADSRSVDSSSAFPADFTESLSDSIRQSIYAVYTTGGGGVTVNVDPAVMTLATAGGTVVMPNISVVPASMNLTTPGGTVSLQASPASASMNLVTAGGSVSMPPIAVSPAEMTLETAGGVVAMPAISVEAVSLNLETAGGVVVMPSIAVEPAIMTLEMLYGSVIAGGVTVAVAPCSMSLETVGGGVVMPVISVAPAEMILETHGGIVDMVVGPIDPTIMNLVTAGGAVQLVANVAPSVMTLQTAGGTVVMPPISVAPAIMLLVTAGGVVIGGDTFTAMYLTGLRVVAPELSDLTIAIPELDGLNIEGGS